MYVCVYMSLPLRAEGTSDTERVSTAWWPIRRAREERGTSFRFFLFLFYFIIFFILDRYERDVRFYSGRKWERRSARSSTPSGM